MCSWIMAIDSPRLIKDIRMMENRNNGLFPTYFWMKTMPIMMKRSCTKLIMSEVYSPKLLLKVLMNNPPCVIIITPPVPCRIKHR